MDDKELQSLIGKYLDGTCTKEEKELVDKALSSYDQDIESQSYLESEESIKEEIYSNILNNVRINSEKPFSKKLYERKWFSVVASILVLIGFASAFFLSETPEQEQEVVHNLLIETTQWGQKSSIRLSDGTQITLNAGSSLEYPDSFQGDSIREVKLIGEAFFEVAKNPDQPFVIRTENVTTKVLGTSFNVNSYPFNDDISITVRTGKVQVQSTSNNGNVDTVYLAPNEKAQYNRSSNQIIKSAIENQNYLDWKNGIIRFSDITFLEASEMLSRWYGINIEFENSSLKECHVTARYEHAKLQVVLESIKFATKGMDYEYLDDYNIRFKGHCKN